MSSILFTDNYRIFFRRTEPLSVPTLNKEVDALESYISGQIYIPHTATLHLFDSGGRVTSSDRGDGAPCHCSSPCYLFSLFASETLVEREIKGWLMYWAQSWGFHLCPNGITKWVETILFAGPKDLNYRKRERILWGKCIACETYMPKKGKRDVYRTFRRKYTSIERNLRKETTKRTNRQRNKV